MLAKHISYQRDLLGSACSERTVGSRCNQPSNSSGPMGCSLSTGLLLLCLPTSVSMLVIPLLQTSALQMSCLVDDRDLARTGTVASD